MELDRILTLDTALELVETGGIDLLPFDTTPVLRYVDSFHIYFYELKRDRVPPYFENTISILRYGVNGGNRK